MQYVNCLYSAQGEYICQKNERLVNEPIVEGFFGDADAFAKKPLSPEQKQTRSYEEMTKSCSKDVGNKNECIEKLTSFHNDKCSREACSALSKCGKSRKDPCPKGQLKQCSDAKFIQNMITTGTNYITKKTAIPDEKGMPKLC